MAREEKFGTKIGANEISKGTVLLIDGQMYKTIDLERVKPGKGGAFIKATMQNIKTKDSKPVRFSTEEDVFKVSVFEFKCTLFENNANNMKFINDATFDEIIVSKEEFPQCNQITDSTTVFLLIAENNDLIDVRLR